MRDRSDKVAFAGDRPPRLDWIDCSLLTIAALFVLLLLAGLLDEAFALDRPRDPDEQLPVWGVYQCLPRPTEDRPRCRFLTPVDLDRETCEPIATAVRARMKGSTVDCVADGGRIARLLGPAIFAREDDLPGAPLSGKPSGPTP